MYNSITIVGRLTSQPELKYLSNGTAVATFTLAVGRARKDSQGNKTTDFIQVQSWAKLAELVANYLDKGKLALVEGELQIDKWEKDGVKHSTPKVNANRVVFLSPKDNSQQSNPLGNEISYSDDDIPF